MIRLSLFQTMWHSHSLHRAAPGFYVDIFLFSLSLLLDVSYRGLLENYKQRDDERPTTNGQRADL